LDKVREESEKRKNIGLNWKRRADTLQASQGGHSEAIAAKDKEIEELKARITGLEKELEEVRGKLGETEKKLEGSQRAEALKEGTVQRLQSELAAARAQGGQAAQTAGPGPDAAALVSPCTG
jgi:nucleoprotein TPR